MFDFIIERAKTRDSFYTLLWQLVANAYKYDVRLIIENPWNPNGLSYLQRNFIKPSIIDRNRMMRGDYFIKPTAYWFVNCTPTRGLTMQNDKVQKTVKGAKKGIHSGICSQERSLISPDYARNWICDFVLGKVQKHSQVQLNLFD